MNLHALGLVRRSVRSVSAPLGSGVVILLYHRVFEAISDPQLLCVTPQHFAKQLEHLRKHYQVLSLQELAETLRIGRLPKRAVVLTFDDGYADNLHSAKPLLERYDVPATVFVTSSYVGKDYEFWWDDLDRILLQPGVLPGVLPLYINGTMQKWELGEAARWSAADFERHHSWSVQQEEIPSPRHYLYHSLCGFVRPLSEAERRIVLEELQKWAGAKATGRPTHRALAPDEVVRLAQGNLVEIGSHGASHSPLSGLAAADQRNEIQGSKQYLEQIVGRPVTSFSYPYGSSSDYTTDTVGLVTQAGFACACSNFVGAVRRRTDLYQLPRLLVRDWDGEQFGRRLKAAWLS